MSDVAVRFDDVAATGSDGTPTVAIAFGGGGARGYAHIHIVEVLNELGIKPVAISGASIGAIMGSCMAAGMSGLEMRDYTLTMVSKRAELLSRFWAASRGGMSEAFENGFRIGQFNIERILKAFLPERIPATFEDLSIPMAIVATDYYGHRQIFFEDGDLISAIGASAALPAVFKPVRRDGAFCIDGGIVNPVPYDHLVGKADIVIGIDVVGAPLGHPDTAPSAVDSLYGASQLMMQSLIQHQLMVRAPDIFIRPPVSEFRVMDFLKAKRIIEESASVRDDFKYKLDAAMAAWEAERRAGG